MPTSRRVHRLARNVLVLAALCVPLSLVPAMPAAAATLTFTATHDATVRESAPTTAYGAATTLQVDGAPRKDALLRFDVAGLSGATVGRATLRLTVTDASPSGGTVAVAPTGWDEATVTWQNAPAAGAVLAAIGAVAAGSTYDVDVTAAVTGDGPVAFRITSTSSNGADYTSSEGGANGPRLLVETGAPPAPDEGPPTAPANLRTTSVLASQVSLAWDAATDDVGVTGYRVSRDGVAVGTVDAPATSFVDGTVSGGTAYDYSVKALDAAGGVSPPSNTLTVTTPAAQTATFDITRDGATSTYHATSQTTTAHYVGSLKVVVETALTTLKSSGGGRILFAAGDFDLGTDQFEIDGVTDVTFAGAVMGLTTIRNLTNASKDTEPFDAVRSDRLVIRDLTVSAGGSDRSTSDALDFDGGDDILIERVTVSDSRARGIVFDGKDAVSSTGGTALRNVVRDCVVTNTPGDGIQLLAAASNRIENCRISGAGAEGIRLHISSSSSAQPLKTSDDNLVIGNVVEGSAGNGISVTGGKRNVIRGNTVRDNGTHGVRIYTPTSSRDCDDNQVLENAISRNDWGITIESSQCHRTVVGGNTFSGNSLGTILDRGSGTIFTGADTTAPTAPSNLRSTGATSSSISLAWDAASDATGVTAYDVYRGSTLAGSVSGTVLTFTDGSLAPGTSYTYVVKARDAAGNTSAPSAGLTASTAAAPVEGSPVTVTASADATLRQASATTNFGTSSTLEVDGDSRKDALLRFPVSGLGGAGVAKAVLRMYATDPAPVGGSVHRVDDTTWGETTVTYSTAPAAGTLLGSFGAVSAGAWYEVDVTPLVTGDGTVSVRIVSANSNGADYASRESATGNAPRLVITPAAP